MTNNSNQEEVPQEVIELEEIDAPANHNTEILGLKNQIKKLEHELLLSIADADNTRKRYDRQMQEIKDYAVFKMAGDIISIMDNINMALHHAQQEMTDAMRNIIIGIEMTKSNLERIFKQYEIEQIAPQVGETFDPSIHSATAQEVNPEFADNAIIKMMQCGYRLKARLLRPAMVAVARNGA